MIPEIVITDLELAITVRAALLDSFDKATDEYDDARRNWASCQGDGMDVTSDLRILKWNVQALANAIQRVTDEITSLRNQDCEDSKFSNFPGGAWADSSLDLKPPF